MVYLLFFWGCVSGFELGCSPDLGLGPQSFSAGLYGWVVPYGTANLGTDPRCDLLAQVKPAEEAPCCSKDVGEGEGVTIGIRVVGSPLPIC